MIVYSLVFSVFLRAVPPDSGSGENNFALYLFSGLVPWALFAGMLNEEPPMAAHFFEFAGGAFRRVATIPDDGMFD